MPEKVTEIIIPLVGISTGQRNPRAIYDPLSVKVLSGFGPIVTQRASNVEPGGALSQAALLCLMPEFVETTPVDGLTATSVSLLKVRDEYVNHWFADMTLCGHNVVLGPYAPEDRELALREEVAWLREHNIPVCEPCITQSKPTGRCSSETPVYAHVSRQPNLQITRRAVPPLTDRQWWDVDFKSLEGEIYKYAEDMAADTAIELLNGLMRGGPHNDLDTDRLYDQRYPVANRLLVEGLRQCVLYGFSGWRITENTYETVVHTAPSPSCQDSVRRVQRVVVEFHDDSAEVLFHDFAAAR